MRALPSMILLMTLGFAADGVAGMAWGAGFGAVCCLVASYIEDKREVMQAREIAAGLKELREVRAEIKQALAEAHRVNLAILDALPLLHYDLLDARTPRTQEEWAAVWPLKWPLLRRRLVTGYGLPEDAVDAARNRIQDQHACSQPLPRTVDELHRMVALWEAC